MYYIAIVEDEQEYAEQLQTFLEQYGARDTISDLR